ncbi:hypothetical protein IGI04_016883, partial [Brassica rapa subsp. trilocularis]
IVYWAEIEFGPYSHNLHLVAQLTSPLLVSSSTRSQTHQNSGWSSSCAILMIRSGEGFAKFLLRSVAMSLLMLLVFLMLHLLFETVMMLLDKTPLSLTPNPFSSLPFLKSPDHQLLLYAEILVSLQPPSCLRRSLRVVIFLSQCFFIELCHPFLIPFLQFLHLELKIPMPRLSFPQVTYP